MVFVAKTVYYQLLWQLIQQKLTFFKKIVLVGLVFYFKFPCRTPNKKVPEQYWISGIEIKNFKFGNSHFIFGTETERKMASSEQGDWDSTGRGCSQMVKTGNFPDFSWKNPVPGKQHSGTQTSNLLCWSYTLLASACVFLWSRRNTIYT